MIRPEFIVTYIDGGRAERVSATPKDLVAFEREFGVSLGSADPGRIEYLYYMAWVALHNKAREPRNFDDFLSVIEDVEDVTETGDEGKNDEPDPTKSGPSPD